MEEEGVKDIPEFDQEEILATPENNYDNIGVYHDNFKECDELFKAYQTQLGDMRLLGIMTDADGNLRCEKDGVIHWVNEKELTK